MWINCKRVIGTDNPHRLKKFANRLKNGRPNDPFFSKFFRRRDLRGDKKLIEPSGGRWRQHRRYSVVVGYSKNRNVRQCQCIKEHVKCGQEPGPDNPCPVGAKKHKNNSPRWSSVHSSTRAMFLLTSIITVNTFKSNIRTFIFFHIFIKISSNVNRSFYLISHHENVSIHNQLLFLGFLFKSIKLKTKERIVFPLQISSLFAASFPFVWWTCRSSASRFIAARPSQSSQSRWNDIIWHVFQMALKTDCMQSFVVSQRTHVVGVVLEMRL